MDVNYITIPTEHVSEETWTGTQSGRYWELERYLLPVCKFVD